MDKPIEKKHVVIIGTSGAGKTSEIAKMIINMNHDDFQIIVPETIIDSIKNNHNSEESIIYTINNHPINTSKVLLKNSRIIGIGGSIKKGQTCFYNSYDKKIIAAECIVDDVIYVYKPITVSIILKESGKKITEVSPYYECFETKEKALIKLEEDKK